MHRSHHTSTLHIVTLSLSLSLAACAAEDQEAPPAATDAEIARLTGELAPVPGDLVVTRSSQMPFSGELRAQLAAAGKVIHVYADGTVHAYVGAPANAPAGVKVERVFRQHGGDIVLGDQQLLPDYLVQEEPEQAAKGTSNAVGLTIGNGALWADSTVAYEIDAAFSASELAAIRQAITGWNASLDPSGTPIKVRFVPRYWADNRPYVRFVRGGSGGCGSSQVGRHDNVFTNWWSHNINLDCFDQHTIQHEMGHTAGLYHEQQRCDRDNFVWVRATGGVNCERYCGGGAADYGPYNYLSVMHYSYSSDPAACSIAQIVPLSSYYRGQPWQAGSAPALDSYDILAINQMYAGSSLPRIGAGIYFNLIPQFTTKTFAIGASSQTNGVQVVLYDTYAGVWDQQWSVRNTSAGYVELRPRHALGKCMEDLSFVTANGGAVGQWDCWGGDNQQWILAPSAGAPGLYDLINKYSGKSVDVPGWSNTNGTIIQQYDHTNGTNQRIRLSPAY
jgi:hypothetical protein